ncbi:orotidine-5'-phosphate decarboxylase [Candidatus Curtissbacteria bacterium]|nr:orotidine-5'-phosphate decarboxylase [Candidatus Curtissbacteria bacterium]
MTFKQKFQNIVKKNNSLVCVGLDPESEKLPGGISQFEFNKQVIDATHDLVCAYKPNSAFYEAAGIEGLQSLRDTIAYLKKEHPEVPIVLDAKRGDIGNTAKMYATAAFDVYGADAVTVYPHLGRDSLEPFFSYQDKLVIVLFKTSNPDSGTFQNLKVDGVNYYLKVAQEIKSWGIGNLGVFVGATYPEEMKSLRDLFPDEIFLSAGIGAQGAEIEQIVKAGIDKNGEGIMFNASRSIIFDKDPRTAAQKLRDEINKYR